MRRPAPPARRAAPARGLRRRAGARHRAAAVHAPGRGHGGGRRGRPEAPQRPLPHRPRAVARRSLRASPGGRVLHRLGVRTEFGSRRILSVTAPPRRLARRRRLRAPERPRRLDPRAPRGAGEHELVRSTSTARARRLTLRREGRAVRSFPVAVGRPGTETPTGRFAVTDKLHPDDPGSPYGCCASPSPATRRS